MPFVLKKHLDHGTANPIVARLALQTLKLLQQTTAQRALADGVGKLYVENLQRSLLRCYEINERFRIAFSDAVKSYGHEPQQRNAIHVPQIPNIEAELHNFLIEAKTYVRDVLKVVNLLHGTDFEEASEFTRARKKKGARSLLEFAEKTFGEYDPQTKGLQAFGPFIEEIVAKRNAVEHPGGYSGHLIIKNFEPHPAGCLDEPEWCREKNGMILAEASSIRSDLDAIIDNLLVLGEEIFISWAAANLRGDGMMQIAEVPEAQRDVACAMRFVVTAGPALQALIAKVQNGGRSTLGD